MTNYTLSVTELALPSPRVGSIDTYSGFALSSQLAIKTHQYFQLQQTKQNPDYQAEVETRHTFKFKGYSFTLSGRMDGVYYENPLRIEEIKTAFDPLKLIELLKESSFTHPYWLQLQVYGYLHYLKTKQIPKLNLLVISLRNKKKTYPLPFDLDIQAFELWLTRRLKELVREIEESQKRIKRRQALHKQCLFPYDAPRTQQKELMDVVSHHMAHKKPMLIQAPTGLGKTLGILYPTLKESLKRGQKTIYLTPKNSQHHIALNSVQLLQAKGAGCKTLVLTAKRKICMKNEPLCASHYCEFAENHYSKMVDNQLIQKAQKKKNLGEAFFKKMAREYQVCPYELQMDCIALADVVIGDYNYVFSSTPSPSRVTKIPLGEHEKPNLVIDEVHNLPARGMDYFSPILQVSFFESYLSNLERYPHRFKDKLIERVSQCISLIHQCALPGVLTPHPVKLSEKIFKEQEERLNQLLTEYLESDLNIETNDPILRLVNYWYEFTTALECINQEQEEFFIFFHPKLNQLKIACFDASSFLKEHYPQFQQVIGFSATLKPFSYYSQLIGLNTNSLHTEEFLSPFSSANRKLLVIPQVSTKYKDRTANYLKIVEVINRISHLKKGNYFVFFPSFEFLEQVFKLMPQSDFTLLRQERIMTSAQIDSLLKQLKKVDKHHLFFAVQGGLFSEGIDYVGEMAIGAFIIGPPLPNYDWEREQMKGYYQKRYNAGKEYAYIYPAMAKAIQAAGRVIRTETDRGLIVLLDNRFLDPQYNQCMPKDWFKTHPKELISNAILKDIKQFWEQQEISTKVF
ncbi:ATP-dependent DNA helicase [Legionella sp. km772]|uniref:ATP-dependent DNA helicase n=1 Tax=Legionella sp. km772 TaxID=2498111 RepID=UPI000F8E7D1F|nr:ATP-dependent DNA helicase [Legionella sp. km772]RUR08309.1 ATP-dependent DNA helicase [Legionella sp. km772]